MDLTMEQARRGRLLFEQAQKEGEETGTKKKEEEVEEGEEDQGEEMQEEEEETAEVATSSKNKCTPRVTRSRAQKGCRVMLFPLKMSPQKPLRMSPQKLTQIIRVRRNRMAERRRK
ncbi:hypothetical protein CgunFtcFv8_018765 [Champsocephalus gunnari]|uniref:Uncharacterized protein n=2 Tax=Champsocephalus gunnari TaxID=52237 RepID=A0AAN8BTI1_CHAGU|nr:hypothetical protein CgunFtcFv8_018765 [Champsocephalus gunnari]